MESVTGQPSPEPSPSDQGSSSAASSGAPFATSAGELEALRRALGEAQERAEAHLASWQRAQADFANYRRRADQEKSEIQKYAGSAILVSLLPLLDNLDRALATLPPGLQGFTWIEGIALLRWKLWSLLEGQGVSEIKVEGAMFDPSIHEAVASGEGEEGKVLDVVQKGYRIHERVLRPVLVKVGRGVQVDPSPATTGRGN